MRLSVVSLVAALAVLFALPAKGREPESPKRCVDVAVVARIVRQTPTEIPEVPGQIIMRWPWVVDLEVEEVVAGSEKRARIQVTMSLHSEFTSRIRHGLFLLRRSENGRYAVVDWDSYVVTDRSGEFVIPVAEPPGDHDLAPEGWLPASYEFWLKPIRYQSGQAWWLNMNYEGEDRPPDGEDAWRTVTKGVVVAKRGFRASDVPSLLEASHLSPCEADATAR